MFTLKGTGTLISWCLPFQAEWLVLIFCIRVLQCLPQALLDSLLHVDQHEHQLDKYAPTSKVSRMTQLRD